MSTPGTPLRPATLAQSPIPDSTANQRPDWPLLDTGEVLRRYRQRSLSPVELTQAVLARIDRHQPTHNAWRHIDHEGALAGAKASEQRWAQGRPLGPLDGVPVGFKDLLHVRGWPTRKGSLATSPRCQEEDSPVAARLRETGAVFLGKTQTAEFGWTGLTESELGGITRNAWHTDHASGGSSGGAAVAAALGLGLQIGTDGGGSIRGPAATNGVFGFKPSYGRVPGHPSALNGNLFHIGPITLTVTDAARLLNVVAWPDVRDWTSLPASDHNWLEDIADAQTESLRGLRVAYAPTLYGIAVHAEIRAAVDRTVRRLADLGAQVRVVQPDIANPEPILRVLAAERSQRLLREVGPEGLQRVAPNIRAAVAQAERYTLADVIEAHEQRAAFAVQWRRFFKDADLLVTPVQSDLVPRVGTAPPVPFLGTFNLTQQPAASAPIGLDSRGLPLAAHLVGGPWQDAVVLRASRALERAQPFPKIHLTGTKNA